MPYYIGDVIKEEKKLIARTPEKFREMGIDVRINTRAEEVDEKAGQVRLSDDTALPYDVLVLGMGTTALTPGLPGEDLECEHSRGFPTPSGSRPGSGISPAGKRSSSGPVSSGWR